MVHTLYAVMCAFALAATVRIVDEGFLKYGGYVVVYEMVHHPVTKIGSKYLTFYWFVYNDRTA